MGKQQRSVVHWLLGATLAGATIGAGATLVEPEGRAQALAVMGDAAVAVGVARARPPQPGDYWGGCNDAREAGTAPIYRGEPGYRENMDGDGDGVACEPYR